MNRKLLYSMVVCGVLIALLSWFSSAPLIFIFLGVSWYFSYEEVVETAEQQLGWLLFCTPVVLILIVRWLSSMENSYWFFSASLPGERRGRTHQGLSEGSSPWGVAALILVLLIMVQYQSNFLDSWFV